MLMALSSVCAGVRTGWWWGAGIFDFILLTITNFTKLNHNKPEIKLNSLSQLDCT